MQEVDFFDAVRDLWESVKPSASAGTQSHISIETMLYQGKMASANRHWAAAARLAFVTLANNSVQRKILAYIKGLRYKTPIVFGSEPWLHLFVLRFYAKFPIASGNVDNFFLSLRPPTLDDYEKFPQFANTGYGVLGERDLSLLSNSGDAETWQRNARRLYMDFFLEATNIFLVVHTAKQDAARYRLERSLGISPNQRVFLARNVDDSKDVVAIKWDDYIDDALENWRDIRRAGVSMINFKTHHSLSPTQNVLLTEILSPLGSNEDTMRMLSDVLLQLSQLHTRYRIYVHSDLKPDNILKRADGSYWIIDWDNISNQTTVVKNSVKRAAYSPVWTSQSFSYGLPTSYRYDLQELWYAAVDLEKRRVEQMLRKNNPDAEVPDHLASADTLAARGLDLFAIHQQIHVRDLAFSVRLNDLWYMIMDLPERLPTSEIDYSSLLEFVNKLMERRDRKNSTTALNARLALATTCANCDRSTDNMQIKDMDGRTVYVCNHNCAALVNDAYMPAARRRHEIFSAVRVDGTCKTCGEHAASMCECGALYCSEACQTEDWSVHKFLHR